MAKVTVTEAARLVGLTRQHLYRAYITKGKLSIDRDFNGRPMVDTSELLRVFGELKETLDCDKWRHQETVSDDGYDAVSHGDERSEVEIIRLLKQELAEAKAREKEILERAAEREAWLRQQLERAQAVLTDQRQISKPWWKFW
ncbi:hypothetical protein [Acidithiobacillus caldus]|uniref:hypothetical protein n=1 Tax=Acidithiobacillus caldus TaxID=33059 RepID=UPI00114D1DCF|nr:hypothetical protein [Acidithiobacillus caldus]